MAQYIRADKRKGKTYYWLVESHREGDRVVQTRLEYLGTTKPMLEEAKWRHAFGDKPVVRAKKIAPEKKPPPMPKEVPPAGEDDLSWLLG